MKKIILILMIASVASFAYADRYTCFCVGTTEGYKCVSKPGMPPGNYKALVSNIHSKFIESFMGSSATASLKLRGAAHSKLTGWICWKE